MEMLDRARELDRIPTFPPLRGALPERALARMAADADETPVIDDELYLEYHRGVYTSQAAVKAWNRRLQSLLGAAEVASAHAVFVAPADAWYNYPRGALTEAWEKTLFNQFHDILPGSGIGPIYVDAVADYREAARGADMALERAGEMIGATLDTRPPVEGARPWLVLNPSGHARGGTVAIPWTGATPRVVDGSGRALTSTVRADTLRVIVADVPPTGGAVVFVVPADVGAAGNHAAGLPTEGVEGFDGRPEVGAPAAATDPAPETVTRPGPSSAAVVLENERLRVEVDPATGELARVVDLGSGREILQPGGGGNRLATREDRPLQWDAWNIDDTDAPWEPIADSVRVGEPGRDALGRFVEVVRADRHGRFTQRLFLPDGARRLEVETHALWRADHRLLKAAFPLAVSADSVWAEIPYGAIARPAVPRTRRDSARYEVPMQRWIDASDGAWGVSLVNDAKHGYDVRGDTLRLTLLKAPKWPDDHADMGEHVFRYDLVVHDGDWRSGATEAAAEALNAPLRAVPVEAHEGEGRSRAFVSVSGGGIRLGALKVAEDDAATLVLRLVERHGAGSTATLDLPWTFEWRSADLLERPEEGGAWTASEGTRADVLLAPWEIATVLVRRR
jgi:alpha-mannosidase